MFRAVPVVSLTPDQRAALPAILRAALSHVPSAYNAPGEAEDEAARFFSDPDRQAWAALDGGDVLGWIGAIRAYDGNVWELHPLVVAPAAQRRGVGLFLVATLEAHARDAGVSTITLGTDDDYAGTTLFAANLFPDPLKALAAIAPTERGHAYTFYLRAGFALTGVIPDANGPGKPDLLMSKRVSSTDQ